MPRLTSDAYGKSRVRLLKVNRTGDQNDVVEITVHIRLQGDFAAAYTDADNSTVLPTDTMKNTVYALALEHPLDSLESFALHLGSYFRDGHEPAQVATVELTEKSWKRINVAGQPHPTAFLHGSDEKQTCTVVVADDGTRVESGIDDLVILSTTGSAFSGFPRDRFTTLEDTRDRLFATSVTATWSYGEDVDYTVGRTTVRRTLLETFAIHDSESVQHTLHDLGAAILEAVPAVSRISLTMPNKHCNLVDLSPFGMNNENVIFVPTDEPHGLIQGTLER